jgi:hypothetical protein
VEIIFFKVKEGVADALCGFRSHLSTAVAF